MTLGIHIQHNTFKTDMSSKQEILKKDVFPPYHKRWSKRKFPLRNRTSDLRIPRSDALPLSHRDSMVSKTITKFIYDTSCILLGSALSIACLQIEYETWLIFELGKEIYIRELTLVKRRRNIFLCFFTELKIYHLSFSIHQKS